jgi:ABC-type phosphate transport system substrate-binding protein
MKSIIAIKFIIVFFSLSSAFAQADLTASVKEAPVTNSTEPTKSLKKNPQVVRITGVRFAYPLVEKWIDGFNKEYPEVQVIIEQRSSSDPSSDILLEAYEQPAEIKSGREYVYVARYAVLPVANSKSAFAKTFGDKGLNKDLIVQLFFHDIYADKENQKEIKEPVTIYTRLQKAGAPTTFAEHFGYQQKDVKGKAIAGADEHLLKAVLRDSTGLTYLPLSLIYESDTKKIVNGITVLPVDLNGNGKVNDDEKFYNDLSAVTQRFEANSSSDLNNVPIQYLHFSVDKKGVTPEALTFLTWVVRNGEQDLHEFGYLNPEPGKVEKEKFEQFASKRIK